MHEHTDSCAMLGEADHRKLALLHDRLMLLHDLKGLFEAEISRLSTLERQLDDSIDLYVSAVQTLISNGQATATKGQQADG